MTTEIFALLLAACFVGSCTLTELFRRYALRAQIIDLPNNRSSHVTPVPRGGGVAFAVTSLVFICLLGLIHPDSRTMVIAMAGGGLLVLTLGFIDDRKHVPARLRLLGHLVAAVWVLWWMGPIPAVPVLGVEVNLGVVGSLLCLLHLVWMVNLFNFMDGIDGIAAIEAVTTALGGALVWWVTSGTHAGWMIAVGFAMCVAGFLVWNWPPARIFMGDSGSGFLGFVIGTLGIWSGQGTPALFWAWFILIGCFMVDATTTLVRRVRRGEKFHEAHRSHAYQYASRKHGSHKRVSLTFGLINLLWLLPLSLLVAARRLDGVTGVVIAYAPLIWLAYRYKAGVRAAQEV